METQTLTPDTEAHYAETVRLFERMERMARHELAMVAFQIRDLPEAHPARIAFYMLAHDSVNQRITEITASN